jgi:hypothetical protein
MFYKSSSHIKTAFSGDERKRTLQHVVQLICKVKLLGAKFRIQATILQQQIKEDLLEGV